MGATEKQRIAQSLQNTFGSSIDESNLERWHLFKEKLETACHEKKADTGSYVCHEGTAADYVYLPEEGMVLLERTAFNGKRQIFAFLFPGNLIGLTATAGSKYSFSARCLNPTVYLQISKKVLDRLMVEFPEIGQRYRDITQNVLGKILDQMFVLGQKKAKQRLAHFLIEMSKHSELINQEDELILPMHRLEIADFLGMTLETTSRTFTELRNSNYIVLKNAQQIKIVDQEALSALAEL